MRRRVPPQQGHQALAAYHAGDTSAETIATATRFTVEELASRAPGRSVEVRVPPYAAAQCIAGPSHTRGTPPAVVETDPETWLALVTGTLTWDSAVQSGAVRASGQRATLGEHLPLTFPEDS